ncbi:MAG: xanthine phosphoribosyltransferase [Clostridia bacterium]|nr:xanthine phosphoribosyltransferase [Clostridia bacterium]
MNTLEKMILDKALVLDGGILKVDMFLNHQIDPHLIMSMGKDFHEHFKNREITKVLTVEASGIPIALATALEFDVPVVFAKKGRNKNVGPDVYTSQVYSYTKGEPYEINIFKKYLTADDKVLFIDDFLANGAAAKGILDIVGQAGATLMGVGIAIEKGFQDGGALLRGMGIDLYSLAIIEAMEPGKITLREHE